MVYSPGKLIACIKVNGQVLRETDNSVSIPFGSEYSVLLKNLNSKRRVQVKVSVDGTDATDGTWLIIGPNQSLELERYIRDGNLQSGNKFKFIPRTKQIEKHRGLKADDGLVRIEYKTEKVTTTEDVHLTRTHHHDVHVYDYNWPSWPRPCRPFWPRPYYPHWGEIWCGTSSNGVAGSDNNITNTLVQNDSVQSCNMLAFNSSGSLGNVQASASTPSEVRGSFTKSASPLRSRSFSTKATDPLVDDSGITVPGSESNQQFYQAESFPVHEQSEVIVIKLRGAVGGTPVTKAVTVKTKATCPTCGKKSKSGVKFCPQCGTALNLL